MPKIAHIQNHDSSAERGADKLTKIAHSASQQGADAVRDSTERTLTSATEAADDGRQIVQRSAAESAEFGRTVVDLLGEQTRHNMQFATAFGRAMNWDQVAEMQRDFLAGSFDRMNQLGERYRVMMQAGMKSMTFPVRR